MTADARDWPSGRYTVRQKVSNSAIRGFSYFDLTQKEPGPEEPDPPEKPDPPTPPKPDRPVKPGKPSKPSSKPAGNSEPVAEPYVEEKVEVSAGEPVCIAASAPTPSKPGKPEEPKEKKNEILRALGEKRRQALVWFGR